MSGKTFGDSVRSPAQRCPENGRALESAIHYSELATFVEDKLSDFARNSRQLLEIDNEVRTATFLTRDDSGNYGFAHKSYREYFLASYLAKGLRAGRTDNLKIGQLSPEVCGFVVDMVSTRSVDRLLEKLLRREYQPEISENALLLLYRLRRRQAAADHGGEVLVSLPQTAKLRGAKLGQAVLERAVLHGADLRGADLQEALLLGSDLKEANLTEARLTNANLSDASLHGVRAMKAVFEGANASGVDFAEADLRSSKFNGANLAGAKISLTRLAGMEYGYAEVPNDLRATSGETESLERVIQEAIGTPWSQTNDRLSENIIWAAKLATKRMALRSDVTWEDIASEVYLHLQRSKAAQDALADDQRLRYRLFHMARSAVYRRFRSSRRMENIPDLDTAFAARDWDVGREEREKRLRDVVASEIEDKLAPDVARIARRFFLAEESVAEIARREDVSKTTVWRRIRQARRVLAESTNLQDLQTL